MRDARTRAARPVIALVIEDEWDHRELVRRTLEDAGWKVELAEDGIAGLGRIPRIRPDVILFDLRMPHLSGAGLLTMLRSTPAGRSIRVVLTTGADVPPEVRALADDVLVKPFGARELLRAVERAGRPGARPA